MKIIKSVVMDLIAQEMPRGARVLDLGCGDGQLLEYLQYNNEITGYGVDIDPEAILSCIKKGINAIHFNLDNMPLDFANKSFDVVIFNQTIQQIHNVDALISEMLRIGKEGFLGFTNFGYFPVRMELLLKGRMPINKVFPYEWYDTPNVHYLTIKDFKQYCQKHNILIKKEIYLARHKFHSGYKKITFKPNMNAELAFYKISKEDS